MEYSRSLSRLQRLCSKAEYCRADIYRKALKDLDGDAEEAARLVEELVRDRYVDDARYASAYAREKAGLQGWGPVKIRFQLRSRGISEADIAAALADVDSAAASGRLERLLATKAHALSGDPQFRLKLIKFGLSRGYEYSQIEEALGSFMNKG